MLPPPDTAQRLRQLPLQALPASGHESGEHQDRKVLARAAHAEHPGSAHAPTTLREPREPHGHLGLRPGRAGGAADAGGQVRADQHGRAGRGDRPLVEAGARQARASGRDRDPGRAEPVGARALLPGHRRGPGRSEAADGDLRPLAGPKHPLLRALHQRHPRLPRPLPQRPGQPAEARAGGVLVPRGLPRLPLPLRDFLRPQRRGAQPEAEPAPRRRRRLRAPVPGGGEAPEVERDAGGAGAAEGRVSDLHGPVPAGGPGQGARDPGLPAPGPSPAAEASWPRRRGWGRGRGQGRGRGRGRQQRWRGVGAGAGCTGGAAGAGGG